MVSAPTVGIDRSRTVDQPPCRLAGEWTRDDNVQKVELFQAGSQWFGTLVSSASLRGREAGIPHAQGFHVRRAETLLHGHRRRTDLRDASRRGWSTSTMHTSRSRRISCSCRRVVGGSSLLVRAGWTGWHITVDLSCPAILIELT